MASNLLAMASNLLSQDLAFGHCELLFEGLLFRRLFDLRRCSEHPQDPGFWHIRNLNPELAEHRESGWHFLVDVSSLLSSTSSLRTSFVHAFVTGLLASLRSEHSYYYIVTRTFLRFGGLVVGLPQECALLYNDFNCALRLLYSNALPNLQVAAFRFGGWVPLEVTVQLSTLSRPSKMCGAIAQEHPVGKRMNTGTTRHLPSARCFAFQTFAVFPITRPAEVAAKPGRFRRRTASPISSRSKTWKISSRLFCASASSSARFFSSAASSCAW